MGALIIILLLLAGIIAYLLFASAYLLIDSRQGSLECGLYPLVRARLKLEPSPMIQLSIAGWKQDIALMGRKRQVAQPAAQPTPRSQRLNARTVRRIWAMIKSFRIRQFRLRVDTGDVQLNGLLFPLAYSLARLTGRSIDVNFTNHNELVVEVDNSLARLLWAYARTR